MRVPSCLTFLVTLVGPNLSPGNTVGFNPNKKKLPALCTIYIPPSFKMHYYTITHMKKQEWLSPADTPFLIPHHLPGEKMRCNAHWF